MVICQGNEAYVRLIKNLDTPFLVTWNISKWNKFSWFCIALILSIPSRIMFSQTAFVYLLCTLVKRMLPLVDWQLFEQREKMLRFFRQPTVSLFTYCKYSHVHWRCKIATTPFDDETRSSTQYHCIDARISSNFRSFDFNFVDIQPLIAEELPYLSRCLPRGSPLQFRKSLVPYILAIESEIGRAHRRCPRSLRIPRQRAI